MATWYEIGRNEIKEVEVLRETPKFLVIRDSWDRKGERRVHKACSYTRYFETKDEAVAFHREVLEGRLENARTRLTMAEAYLKEFNQKYPEQGGEK
jgi:hypothetical protein